MQRGDVVTAPLSRYLFYIKSQKKLDIWTVLVYNINIKKESMEEDKLWIIKN